MKNGSGMLQRLRGRHLKEGKSCVILLLGFNERGELLFGILCLFSFVLGFFSTKGERWETVFNSSGLASFNQAAVTLLFY